MFDPKREARKVLEETTEAFMHCMRPEYDNHQQLHDALVENGAFIITENLLKGELKPMEYNAVRNELAEMLWQLFEPYILEEETKKLKKQAAQLEELAESLRKQNCQYTLVYRRHNKE